jgi:hypothetical protein
MARADLPEDKYAQEFECSFDAAIAGSYYGKLMAQAESERRIASVPHDPAVMVWTGWDQGIRDATAIWFAQIVGCEIHIIDYYEASGVDLAHYVRHLARLPYIYAGHIVPHDARARELGTGKSRIEVMEGLGLKNLRIAPPHRIEDGIDAVRMFLPKCWFDAGRCARGIEALKLYRSGQDDKLQVPKPNPVHDWTSHAADAFRYLAMTLDSTASVRTSRDAWSTQSSASSDPSGRTGVRYLSTDTIVRANCASDRVTFDTTPSTSIRLRTSNVCFMRIEHLFKASKPYVIAGLPDQLIRMAKWVIQARCCAARASLPARACPQRSGWLRGRAAAAEGIPCRQSSFSSRSSPLPASCWVRPVRRGRHWPPSAIPIIPSP